MAKLEHLTGERLRVLVLGPITDEYRGDSKELIHRLDILRGTEMRDLLAQRAKLDSRD